MGLNQCQGQNSRDLLLACIEQHPGLRPKELHAILVKSYPTFSYAMVVNCMQKLRASGDVVWVQDNPRVARYYPAPEPAPLPWVHPIRERYLRAVGAIA